MKYKKRNLKNRGMALALAIASLGMMSAVVIAFLFQADRLSQEQQLITMKRSLELKAEIQADVIAQATIDAFTEIAVEGDQTNAIKNLSDFTVQDDGVNVLKPLTNLDKVSYTQTCLSNCTNDTSNFPKAIQLVMQLASTATGLNISYTHDYIIVPGNLSQFSMIYSNQDETLNIGNPTLGAMIVNFEDPGTGRVVYGSGLPTGAIHEGIFVTNVALSAIEVKDGAVPPQYVRGVQANAAGIQTQLAMSYASLKDSADYSLGTDWQTIEEPDYFNIDRNDSVAWEAYFDTLTPGDMDYQKSLGNATSLYLGTGPGKECHVEAFNQGYRYAYVYAGEDPSATSAGEPTSIVDKDGITHTLPAGEIVTSPYFHDDYDEDIIDQRREFVNAVLDSKLDDGTLDETSWSLWRNSTTGEWWGWRAVCEVSRSTYLRNADGSYALDVNGDRQCQVGYEAVDHPRDEDFPNNAYYQQKFCPYIQKNCLYMAGGKSIEEKAYPVEDSQSLEPQGKVFDLGRFAQISNKDENENSAYSCNENLYLADTIYLNQSIQNFPLNDYDTEEARYSSFFANRIQISSWGSKNLAGYTSSEMYSEGKDWDAIKGNLGKYAFIFDGVYSASKNPAWSSFVMGHNAIRSTGNPNFLNKNLDHGGFLMRGILVASQAPHFKLQYGDSFAGYTFEMQPVEEFIDRPPMGMNTRSNTFVHIPTGKSFTRVKPVADAIDNIQNYRPYSTAPVYSGGDKSNSLQTFKEGPIISAD